MNKIMCDCGHLESDHSECTRGYAKHPNGKTFCYECALAHDLWWLKENKSLSAYVSSDGTSVTTWPGSHIARITGGHTVNLGFRRNQLSFNAIMEDGTKLYGFGPGNGMFCRVHIRKNQR